MHNRRVPVAELQSSALFSAKSPHRHNFVIHVSALPQCQDWSLMTWQIVEGAAPFRSLCLISSLISTPDPSTYITDLVTGLQAGC